ncbi:hypothetical protein TSOC_008148 [Tetrabaena socialis]|uniref:Uncharacterized protein n=1 Tax=Tetrabaena socialis TaxID=47790 RepID=A0A2J7ZZ92_9CHLO|nr:hypothetical protein TSOC_008148 [Tetrabaena socialis]|eukprot:PNH05582.1 hypothetical protein TSOC_008148 [Tetrabaena socialis]
MDHQLSILAAALVPRFRDATERLRSGRLLKPSEAHSLKQQLEDVFPATEGAAVAARLLAHDSFPAALLGLLAAALRLDARSSPDACSLALNAHSDLCATASDAAGGLVFDPRGDCPLSPEALGFATRLLRTQALQCYSRWLAAATEDVQAAGAGASLRAASIIRDAACLVDTLADVARRSMADGSGEAGAAPMSGAARRRQQQQQARGLAFLGELAAALRYSCVVEHLARAALHLHLRCAGEAAEATVLQALSACVCVLDMHDACCTAGLSDAPAASSLRGVLGGRCTRHLALSSALAALCAADGGPSYGLPEELLLGLPVFGNNSPPANLRQRQGVQELNFSILHLAVSGLEVNLRMRPAPSLPPGRRAAVALLLRLGRLGLESGRIWGEVNGGSALGQRDGSGAEGQTSAGGAPDFPGGGGGAFRGRGSAGSGYRGSGNAGSEAGIDGGGGGGSGGGGSSGNEGDGGSGGGSVALPTVPAPPPSVPLPQPLRLLVSRNELAHLTTYSLHVALHLLSAVHQQQAEKHEPATAAAAGGGALGGWQEVAAAEWWRLAVAAALHVTRWSNEGEVHALAELFILGTRLGRLPLDSECRAAGEGQAVRGSELE